ncbi:MAG: hypothetical protein Q4D42_04550 [Eubacteriales bacterium]|nr:hypothetical protein [Eubacteriales bacterium]
MKIIKKCFILLLCTALLTGCSLISGGDDLLQTPKPSENFTLLQEQLEKIISEGKTYVTPQSGSYRNTVTFEDIDSDGADEAIVFLRDGTGGKIYVYAFAWEDGEYKEIGSIAGPGSAVGSMSFLTVEDGQEKLLVLTWTLSNEVKQGLTVCRVRDHKLEELLSTTCTNYIVSDMDRDNTEELFTLSYDNTERKTASVYDYDNEKMLLLSQTDATQDVQAIANITAGQLNDSEMQAVFVDNKFENDNGMQTDIYVLDGSTLRNVATSSNTSTYRSTSLYFCEDIDGDGSIEVPQLHALPGYEDREAAETLWMIDWYRYGMGDEAKLVHTIYDSPTEGWMLEFPKEWRNNVTAVSISQSGRNETVFMEQDGLQEQILTIYSFTGEDRKQEASADGLIELGSTSDICFAAKLGDGNTQYDMTEKEVQRAFTVITNEWK